MKIIAQIANSEWMVQANSDELAKCAGYYLNCTTPEIKRPQIGREVNVTEAYATTAGLIESDKELKDAKQKVVSLIGSIEKLQAVLAPKIANLKAKMP